MGQKIENPWFEDQYVAFSVLVHSKEELEVTLKILDKYKIEHDNDVGWNSDYIACLNCSFGPDSHNPVTRKCPPVAELVEE